LEVIGLEFDLQKKAYRMGKKWAEKALKLLVSHATRQAMIAQEIYKIWSENVVGRIRHLEYPSLIVLGCLSGVCTGTTAEAVVDDTSWANARYGIVTSLLFHYSTSYSYFAIFVSQWSPDAIRKIDYQLTLATSAAMTVPMQMTITRRVMLHASNTMIKRISLLSKCPL
jgi:hypothetical protein